MSPIAARLAQVTLGPPMQFENLSLYPLLAEGPAQPEYRLLDEALADGSARVTEVSAEGHVPELRFVNAGARPVLLLDGEELIGAMQNRILNLTVLVPARQSLSIPVSCVEAGRWYAESVEFRSARRAHFAAGRARKAADVSESLRRRGSRESDQGAVWDDIAERSARLGVDSPTSAAAALYDEHRERLDRFHQAFAAQPGQCGALFAVAGRPVGLDLFDSPATLASALGKLVESYALDALAAADGPAASPPDPQAWLETVARTPGERFPAQGEGEDWRLRGPGLTGGALVKDGRVIHLCVFRLPGAAGDGGETGPGGPQGGGPAPEAPPGFGLDLATDRRLLSTRGGSVRYLRLRLQAPRADRERLPLDLALVLDRSGSMGGGKWTQAREAALAALGRLGPRDRVALVTFDDRIDIALPLTPATPEARQAAAAALAEIGPRGQTNLGEGWLTGCGLIGRETAPERLRRCLLLTDGQANVGLTDPAELAAHAAELLGYGVRTSTLGVGDDYHEALLGRLADAGGGAFHDIAGAAGIRAFIDRELGEALEVVCADPRVRLSWEAHLRVQALGDWRCEPDGRSLTIRPGDLVSDQVLDLLVEVEFPAGTPDTDCVLRAAVSDGDRPLAAGELRWTWVDSARRKAQPRDGDLERQLAEWLAHQARRAALVLNGEGNLKGARDRLRAAVGQLRHYGGHDSRILALAETLAGEVERHREPLQARERKADYYKTRNATSGRTANGERVRGGPGAKTADGGGAPKIAPQLLLQPCLDSAERAARCRAALDLPRHLAADLGRTAVAAAQTGHYLDARGNPVDWRAAVEHAVAAKRSLPPEAPLPASAGSGFPQTRVQVANETTLVAARRLTAAGERVLALNFANGIQPGGGFLSGARAQEEVLCRSSALYGTLAGDPMYAAHRERPLPDSTDWAILSPEVPVFRTDDGAPLDQPWTLSVMTCAAPYAPALGQPQAGELLQGRIRRVLAIARAFGYTGLVLGAWGCGAFGNDPERTARDFHTALSEDGAGGFREVVFAISDWSPERRVLAPFARVLAG